MEPNVTDMLRHQLPPNTPSPNPVHRLDRPTSGPLLFSLGPPPVTAALQAALASAEARKQYWVLAFGANMPSQWRNDHALSDMSANRNRNRNRNRATKQRPASSEFELLHAFEQSNICVVRATISTGRRHQIRRHLSNSKYPVVGDTTHGKGPLNRDARQNHGVTRCCLHARRLSFRDPQSDSMVHLQVPVPADLQAVLQTFPDYNCELHDPHLDLGNT